MASPLLKAPNEVLDQILGLVPTKKDLASVALTSKSLYDLALPFLYGDYVKLGIDRIPLRNQSPLWLFVRTILERPDLALLVKEVVIGGPGIVLHIPAFAFHLNDAFRPTEKEWTLLTQTILATGVVPHAHVQIMKGLLWRESNLVLPLLVSLPSLETLRITNSFRWESENQDWSALPILPPMRFFNSLKCFEAKQGWNNRALGDLGTLVDPMTPIVSMFHTPRIQRITISIEPARRQLRFANSATQIPRPQPYPQITDRSSGLQDVGFSQVASRTLPHVEIFTNACRDLKTLRFDKLQTRLFDGRGKTLMHQILSPHAEVLTHLSIEIEQDMINQLESVAVDPDPPLNLSFLENLSCLTICPTEAFGATPDVSDEDTDPHYANTNYVVKVLCENLPGSLKTLHLIVPWLHVRWWLLSIMPELSPKRTGFFPNLANMTVDAVLIPAMWSGVVFNDPKWSPFRYVDAKMYYAYVHSGGEDDTPERSRFIAWSSRHSQVAHVRRLLCPATAATTTRFCYAPTTAWYHSGLREWDLFVPMMMERWARVSTRDVRYEGEGFEERLSRLRIE